VSAVQPEGQQPSLAVVLQVRAVCVQATLHVAFVPVFASAVQAFPSSQVVIDVQRVAAGATSQVSPRFASIFPLPQPGQSTSVVGPQVEGQKPSVVVPPQARGVLVQT
jgi:hypothetical protein